MIDLVSIIVPVYNVEKWLEKSIDSILSQTYKEFELILVNDGSTDNSGEICNKYAEKDKRIKVIHKNNSGVSSARNVGINSAIGKYISFVDSDDILKPNMLDEVIKILNKYDVDIVMFGYELLKTREIRLPGLKVGYMENPIKEVEESVNPHSKNDFSFNWRFMFSRKLIMDIGTVFKEDIKIGEDALFNMELIFNSSAMYIMDKSLYIYNDWNTDSAMRKSYKKNFHIELDKQYKEKIKLINKYKIKNKDFIYDLYYYYIYILIQNCIKNICNGPKKQIYRQIKTLLNCKMTTEGFNYFSIKEIYNISDNLTFFSFMIMIKFRLYMGVYLFCGYFYVR